MYLPNIKSVALPIPELIGGSPKIWGGPWLCPHSLFPRKKFYMPTIQTIPLYVHWFSRDFRLEFRVGVANPQFWGRGGHRGSGMVPFERALANFYRSFLVTFPLSLHVSEILPLLFSSMPLFPYPTSSLPQISPCSPGCRRIAFLLQGAKGFG